jgi:hypothetical protein
VHLRGRVDDGWALELSPTDPELKKVIAAVEIEGKGLGLSTVRVREANGDVSTTRFHDVDAEKRYDAAEADRTFRIPPP